MILGTGIDIIAEGSIPVERVVTNRNHTGEAALIASVKPTPKPHPNISKFLIANIRAIVANMACTLP